MKQITSADFRKEYPRLTEPHEVTALGRVIGRWLPGAADAVVAKAAEAAEAAEPDAGSSWGQFRPAPKPTRKK